jgi:hypothetical protein
MVSPKVVGAIFWSRRLKLSTRSDHKGNGVIGIETQARAEQSRLYPATIETRMANVVNLRTARKQAKRRQSDRTAEVNRIAHGQPKHLRTLEDAKHSKASRDLDGHRIEEGDR